MKRLWTEIQQKKRCETHWGFDVAQRHFCVTLVLDQSDELAGLSSIFYASSLPAEHQASLVECVRTIDRVSIGCFKSSPAVHALSHHSLAQSCNDASSGVIIKDRLVHLKKFQAKLQSFSLYSSHSILIVSRLCFTHYFRHISTSKWLHYNCLWCVVQNYLTKKKLCCFCYRHESLQVTVKQSEINTRHSDSIFELMQFHVWCCVFVARKKNNDNYRQQRVEKKLHFDLCWWMLHRAVL